MLSIFIATHSEKTVLAEGKGRDRREGRWWSITGGTQDWDDKGQIQKASSGLKEESSVAHSVIKQLSWTLELIVDSLCYSSQSCYWICHSLKGNCLFSPLVPSVGQDLGINSLYLKPHCLWFLYFLNGVRVQWDKWEMSISIKPSIESLVKENLSSWFLVLLQI